MFINRLAMALLFASSQLIVPVHAKISDVPNFNIWGSQWGPLTGQPQAQRLPCLRADKGVCSRAFSSPVTGARSARKSAAEPQARPTQSIRTSKRRVVYKNAKRIRAAANRSFAQTNGFADSSVLPQLLLSETSGRLLDVSLEQNEQEQPATVEALADYVSTVETNPPSNSTLLNDATGGLGNNAYVALYDFDDETSLGGGETSGGFQEISSLLDASSLRAAVSVPEPGTGLLLGAGLVLLRAGGRGAKRPWGRTSCAPP